MLQLGFTDSLLVGVLVGNFALTVATGFLAGQKGRNVPAWLTLAIFIPAGWLFFAMVYLGSAVAIGIAGFLGLLIFFTAALSTPLPRAGGQP